MTKADLEQFTLLRSYKDEATTAILLNSRGKRVIFTLEPPNRNNAKNDSKTKENEAGCIPEGIYTCRRRNPKDYEKSKVKPRFLDNWEILNVPDKSGVVFHCGNYWFESESCILVASAIEDKNPTNDPKFDKNKRWCGIKSIDALNIFKSIMPQEFSLKITSIDTLCNVANLG